VDSPLAGLFTSWCALGAYKIPTNKTLDKRSTNQATELESAIKTIAMGFADSDLTRVQFKAKLQELDDSHVDDINR
jgi:hypothetical protein